MKKHKSVVAILLAVMMIFTMMPMMAFAADTKASDNSTATWSDDYSKVTINGTEYKTKKSWADGMIKAEVDKDAYSASAAAAIPDAEVYYYDLTGAQLLVNSSQATQYTRDEFNTVFAGTHSIVLAVPADFQQAVGKTYPVTSLTGWTYEVKKPENFKADATEDQTFTVSAQITTTNTIDGSATLPYIRGSVGSATLTFLGKAKTAENAAFFFDEVADDNAIDTTAEATNKAAYSGADHTVVMKEMAGYSVAYSVFNKNTGAYDSVSAVKVKNVTDSVDVKAVVSNGADKTKAANYKEYFFTVGVSAAINPTFGFDEDGDVRAYTYSVEDDVYDAYSYVLVTANNKASKKAVEADKADLMAFFKDFYQVTETVKKATPNTIKLEIEGKELTQAEVTELAKKYETLIANYGLDDPYYYLIGMDEATLYINYRAPGEIEFVNTPTSKVYKAKVLKKKAKSFKVKAVCDTGHAVSYKLMNAPQKIVIDKETGKITLKKGLKKGTYKIKVKAYINNEYFETHAITIKVKK